MEHLTKSEQERFDSCWEQADGCKLWKNSLDRDGYGSFYLRKKNRRAHRVSYFRHNGAIEDNMVIDHICKKRNCVEISHLRMVTKTQNAIENSNSIAAINRKKITCKYGHPFDRKYAGVRYCSICSNNKRIRLSKKWREEANLTKC